MSEVDKLVNRLTNNPDKKLIDFHVFKGSGWDDSTPEERAKAINKALDQVESGQAKQVDFDD